MTEVTCSGCGKPIPEEITQRFPSGAGVRYRYYHGGCEPKGVVVWPLFGEPPEGERPR